MDNMQIRKDQLQRLDDFVKTLFDECKVFARYMNMSDLETLYLHIHELIQEMLSCDTTDEFMAMIEDLHRAVAGILIIAVPKNAQQIKEDMEGTYDNFEGSDFDEMLKNLQKTSVQKYGGNADKRSDSSARKGGGSQVPEDSVENDPEELIDLMDLNDHVKKPSEKADKPAAPKADPFEDVFKLFEQPKPEVQADDDGEN